MGNFVTLQKFCDFFSFFFLILVLKNSWRMKKQVGEYDMFPKVKMFPQIIQLLKKN